MTKSWDEYWQLILYYYKEQGKTLKDVQKIMEKNHGFKASARAYRTQFLHRNVTKYRRRRASNTSSTCSKEVGHDQEEQADVPIMRDGRVKQESSGHRLFLTKGDASGGAPSFVHTYASISHPLQPIFDGHAQYDAMAGPASHASSPTSTEYSAVEPSSTSPTTTIASTYSLDTDYIHCSTAPVDPSQPTSDAPGVTYSQYDPASSFLPALKSQNSECPHTVDFRQPWSASQVDYGYSLMDVKAPRD